MKISSAAKKAVLIGLMCSISYLAVYVARNILGAVSPQMLESGIFTTESIGALSSTYFVCYAIGQFINGMIGDKIKAKYMISFGLILAGLCFLLFPHLSHSPNAVQIVYGAAGFFLSMIYGPMTKVVAENTEPIYATRCSLGYTFASFLGSPFAGILAALLIWQLVFTIGSGMLIIMGCISFIAFSLFERKGIIRYNQFRKREQKGNSIKILIRHRIIKFTLIAIITGIVKNTVVFWLTTYTSQYLGFSADTSAMIYTIATLIISLSTFVAVFLYETLGRNMDLTILLAFASSAASFLLVFLCKQPIMNISFMVLAILSSNCAASMLWSRYCPSLRDTGLVSSATGYLDAMSYGASSVSSALFANSVSHIGWHGLILVWFGLMVLGTVIALPYDRFLPKRVARSR